MNTVNQASRSALPLAPPSRGKAIANGKAMANGKAIAGPSTPGGGGASAGRLPPKAWHECVAVACGFHACVVGQSIYEPQLRAWLNLFSAPQVAVLTLDEFAAKPSAALGRIANFLGVGAFPRLVLNWKWAWNVAGQSKKKRKKRQIAADSTLSQLRRFFSPYTEALAMLLRKRGQARAAAAVGSWARR